MTYRELIDLFAKGPVIEKKVPLTNRVGTKVEVIIRREVTVVPAVPRVLEGYRLKDTLGYTAADSVRVLNPVTTDQALLAAWTLEQFDATDQTISFGRVESPGRQSTIPWFNGLILMET